MRFCIRLNVNDDGIVTTVQGIYKGTNPSFCRLLESEESPFNEIAVSYNQTPDVRRLARYRRICIRWNDEPLNVEAYGIPLKQLTFNSSFGCCVINGRKGLQGC